MFQLTEEESEIVVSQNVMPSIQHLGSYLPYVFAAHGVLQLSNRNNPFFSPYHVK